MKVKGERCKSGDTAKPVKQKRGPKPIPFDKDMFEFLCSIQCTEEEIASKLEMSVDTLQRRCKGVYGKKFADVFGQKRKIGFISLRRQAWIMAKTNPAVLIFLCKNHLGMTDRPDKPEDAETSLESVADAIERLDAQ